VGLECAFGRASAQTRIRVRQQHDGDDYTPYRVRQGDVIELEKPAVFGKATKLIEMPISWSPMTIRTSSSCVQGIDTARINEHGARAGELDQRLCIYEADNEVGRNHLHVSPFRYRARRTHAAPRKTYQKLKAGGAIFTTLENAVAEYDKRAPFKQ
jgi:hypothetical protein